MLLRVALCILAAKAGWACKCQPPVPACGKYGSTAAIFTGTAISETMIERDRVRLRQVTFRVAENFKGAASDEIVIETGAISPGSCAMPFAMGARYLIYAHQYASSRMLSTGYCSGNRKADDAGEDLAYLRSRRERVPAASITGYVALYPTNAAASQKAANRLGNLTVQAKAKASGKTWTATTNAAGEFEISPLEPGSYWFSAALPRTVRGGEPREVKVEKETCSYIDVAAREPGQIHGVVADTHGLPLGNVPVELQKADSGLPGPSTRSDENGEFHFDYVPEGRYLLGIAIFSPPSGSSRSEYGFPRNFYPGVPEVGLAQVIEVNRESAPMDLRWRAGTPLQQISVRGVVESHDGTPVSIARIDLYVEGYERVAASTTTWREGRFQLDALEGLRYQIHAYTDAGGGWHCHRAPVTPGVEMKLRLDRLGRECDECRNKR